MAYKNGVTNGGGMPTITANRESFPNFGNAYQLFLHVLTGQLWYDNGNGWLSVKCEPVNPYNFRQGLTQGGDGSTGQAYYVTNDLITGIAGDQTIIAGNSQSGFSTLYLKPSNALDGSGYVILATGNIFDGRLIYESGAFAMGENSANIDVTVFGPLTVTSDSVFYKTLAINQNLFQALFDATDITAARTYTFPNVSTRLAGLAAANVFTQNQTMPALIINGTGSGTGGAGYLQAIYQSSAPPGLAGYLSIWGDATGRLCCRKGTGFQRIFDTGTTNGDRTYTFQDASYTLAGLEVAQTFTNLQTFNAGITVVGTSTFPSNASISSGGSITSGGNFVMPNNGIFQSLQKFKIQAGGSDGIINFFKNDGITYATLNGGAINAVGLISPQQATTALAPTYVKGGIYFDTTLNKLRVGGSSAWETITSV